MFASTDSEPGALVIEARRELGCEQIVSLLFTSRRGVWFLSGSFRKTLVLGFERYLSCCSSYYRNRDASVSAVSDTRFTICRTGSAFCRAGCWGSADLGSPS